MSESPRPNPIKPIEKMTALELENYRIFLQHEKAKINARLKELLKEREQRNKAPK